MRLTSQTSYLALLIGLTALGLAWMAINVGEIPQYGDTIEYLHLARTLEVDQYRTILYPLFLHFCGVLTTTNTSPSPFWAYLCQFVLSLTANAIFVSAMTVDLAGANQYGAKSWHIVTIVSFATATSPLMAHLSLSLMSDSLASSLTIATVGSIAHVLARYRPNGLCWRWIIIAGIFLFLMTLSRVDKLYLGLTVAIVSAIWLRRLGLSLHRPHPTRDCACIAIVFGASLSATVLTNHLTQTRNPNRPPLDISSMAFNRVVWPRLNKIYPYLSTDAHKLISEAEAAQFDTHNNYVYPLLARVLAKDPSNKHIINEITLRTLQRFPSQVVSRTAFDITKYALPIVAFPLELVSILPESIGTDWTYSRMTMFTPRSTSAWLTVCFLSLLLIQLPVAFRRSKRTFWRHLIAMPSMNLAVIAITVNALLFGLEAGMDAYVRYALPTFTLEFAMITLIGLVGVAPKDATQRQIGHECLSKIPCATSTLTNNDARRE